VLGDFLVVDVHAGPESSLGKDVDEDGDGHRIFKEMILRIDHRPAADGVSLDDRHHFHLDEVHDREKHLGVLDLIAVKPVHQFLAGMLDDLICQRNLSEAVKCSRVELQRALVFKLADDVLLDDLDQCLGIDEVVVEDLLERDQRVVGLFLEGAVAVAGEFGIEVGGSFLLQVVLVLAGGRCFPPHRRKEP